MTDTPAPTAVTISVDGRAVPAKPGEMIIAAAERAGVYIPRFCYHPRMRPVGMCRMCLVEVVGPRGPMLQPACYVPVAEGQEVITNSPAVKKAQDGVLEFLLVNHPLDCPVCDKGGECPLQDQTFTYGPGETRFVEEKRHWEKPIALSDLVYIDRERCIQCDRCTRFADEVAGDPLIEFVGRGASTEVNTFPDQPFASYFSGNTVQICPVGALLARPYRFKARPWDLEQVESTCTTCSVGCRIAVQSSQDELTRYLGLDSDPVNHGWLCDKGRFSYEAVNSTSRLDTPKVKRADRLETATWADALDAAAQGLSDAVTAYGAEAVGVIGGARLPNEDQYAWTKLAKGVLGTDNVDAQLGDGLPAEVVLGLPRASIDDACDASAVILLAGDLKEELPVLYLRLRGAVRERSLPVMELTSRRTGFSRYASSVVPYLPGEAHLAARSLVDGDLREQLGDAPVVILGRPSIAEPADSVVAAAAVLAALPGVRFLSGLRRGNVHGALDMGMAPGMLPGRVTLDAGRTSFAGAWGKVPGTRGLDTEGILRAAADGRIHGLVLLGADPLGDFPDRGLAVKALERASFVVAADCFLTESVAKANVVLPAATFAERGGTTTNLEGRVTRLGAKITPPAVAWPDWMIAVELAARLGADLGFGSLDEIWDEVQRVSPAHAGLGRGVLSDRRHRDGVLVPLGSEAPRGDAADVDASADPSSTPGVLHAETQGETLLEGHADPKPADESTGAADTTPGAGVPLVEWTPTAPPVREPPPDAYALRLVGVRKLYDDGITVSVSPSLAPLVKEPVLRVHPHDLDRLGVRTGGTVRLRSKGFATTITVEADDLQPRGSAVLPINLPGIDTGSLIDVDAPVNTVGIETPGSST
ncbi:MAG TPA: NADH-quinone oxidoreductase subunit NuoG [Acidimicrobiales bacterium]|nr:NADH-quinone oxidoreductase subunit NuoG [Acidimicrobiales bacterium]